MSELLRSSHRQYAVNGIQYRVKNMEKKKSFYANKPMRGSLTINFLKLFFKVHFFPLRGKSQNLGIKQNSNYSLISNRVVSRNTHFGLN